MSLRVRSMVSGNAPTSTAVDAEADTTETPKACVDCCSSVYTDAIRSATG